jgi:hypothetical protein
MVLDRVHAALEERGRNALRRLAPLNSRPYRLAKGIYTKVVGRVVR